jgi:hypothetical protein
MGQKSSTGQAVFLNKLNEKWGILYVFSGIKIKGRLFIKKINFNLPFFYQILEAHLIFCSIFLLGL